MPSENTAETTPSPAAFKTKHQMAMETLQAKQKEFNDQNSVTVEADEDAFAVAANVLDQSSGAPIAGQAQSEADDDDGTISLEDAGLNTLNRQDDEPESDQSLEIDQAEPVNLDDSGQGEQDPLSEHGLFYDENGELCTTVNVYGEEYDIPVSQVRRDYQTAQAGQRKFREAADLLRQANEFSQKKLEESEEPEGFDSDIDDQIIAKQREITEHDFAGDTEAADSARRELLKLERQAFANSQPGNAPPPQPGTSATLTDEEMAANQWFRGAYPEITGDQQALAEAQRQFHRIAEERSQFGLEPLSAIELAQEAGQATVRVMQLQNHGMDRMKRTQNRRRADAPPRASSVAQGRRKPTSGAEVVTEAALMKGRAEYVAAQNKRKRQFLSQGKPSGM